MTDLKEWHWHDPELGKWIASGCNPATAPPLCTPDALADAALELEQERVERALAWDRARTRVADAKHALVRQIQDYAPWTRDKFFRESVELLAALDELERVEGAL